MTASLGRRPLPFTDAEDVIVIEHYPGKGPAACRDRLPGRSDSAIVARARRLGLPGLKGPLSPEGHASRLHKARLTRQRRQTNPERGERRCLGPCGQMFTSEWVGHRMCDRCRHRAAGIGIGGVPA